MKMNDLYEAVKAVAIQADPDVPMMALAVFAVVAELCETAGEAEQSAVVDKMAELGINRTVTSRHLDVLSFRRRAQNPLGLVSKRAPPPNDRSIDQRKRFVSLTPEGKRLVKTLRAI